MKTTYFFSAAAIIAAMASNASASHIYANSISMHNIATIQDSILHTAIHTFDRVPAANLGGRTKTMMPPTPEKSVGELYGKKPMYGTMSIYGEYEEYEFAGGRSAGDNTPLLKNAQITYQHYFDDASFNNVDKMDSDYDIAMAGITGGRTKLWDGITGWAAYAGYINGEIDNDEIKINERGGFAGIYSRFGLKLFNLSATINGGVLKNDAEYTYGSDTFTNMWAGAAANASFNIILDKTFALQPGLQIGYTWIEADDYISSTGETINNSDMGVFTVAPALHAIKHIGSGWFGTAHVRYVAMMHNGGEVYANHARFDTLESDNYTEYGVSLEKTLGRLNLSGTFVRRDGARDGFGGGLNIKYLF